MSSISLLSLGHFSLDEFFSWKTSKMQLGTWLTDPPLYLDMPENRTRKALVTILLGQVEVDQRSWFWFLTPFENFPWKLLQRTSKLLIWLTSNWLQGSTLFAFWLWTETSGTLVRFMLIQFWSGAYNYSSLPLVDFWF